MSNPRDWFRRRRRDTVLPPERSDPLAELPVLELKPRAKIIDHRTEPTTLRMSKEARTPAAQHQTVPPPPPRPSSLRGGRVIEPEAFSVRPQVTRSVSEVMNEMDPEETKVATLAVRRRAFFIQRRAPGTAVTEPPQAEPLPQAEPSPRPKQPREVTRIEPAVRRTERMPARPETAKTETSSEPARTEARNAEISGVRPAAEPGASLPRFEPLAGKKAAEDPAPDAEDEAMPGFTLAAPGVSWVNSRTTLQDVGAVNAVLRDAFTPTRPKQQTGLFSGRHKQLQRIIAGIEEERAHVVLYGERGSGKTSLANIVAAKAEEAGYHVVKLACSSDLDFDEVFRIALRRIPATFLNEGMGITHRAGIDSFEKLLPEGEIGVADLIRTLERVHDRHVILIFDEYDRITNTATKNKLAELIKNMSDASAPVTILLIGVAENVDELLGYHPSLRRTLVMVPLPLMSSRELEGIIATGERKTGLRFAPEVRRLIVEFAQGLPYHAQLLSLFAARSAVRRHVTRVEMEDLRYAVERAAEEAESRVKDAYSLALASPDGALFKDLLFAAARAPSDEFGTFTLDDVVPPANGIPLAEGLARLTEPDRGAVLRRVSTPDGPRWQFFNQMMRHYVLVRQAAERGLV